MSFLKLKLSTDTIINSYKVEIVIEIIHTQIHTLRVIEIKIFHIF